MIAIIKYNAGNIKSVQNALTRLGCESIVTDDKSEILNADKVIFPGVGQANSVIKYIKEKKIDQIILSISKPFLGICLGLQLMCNHTEEGNVDCLGIFKTNIKKFPKLDKVPHIGWNNFNAIQNNSLLLKDIKQNDDVYYVHSYYAELCENTIATCDYILQFSSVLQKDNFYATQFHPEKSSIVGETILKNFLSL